MSKGSKALRELLAKEKFIFMPSAYNGLGARLIESLGFKAVYNGGFVTGGSRAITEPLLSLTEQVETAGEIASTVRLPVIADAGAGWGEPLHAMRTVREFVRAGVAGIHIEDQLYPKRAHYHKYVAHAIPREEFVDKIRFACKERDKLDPDFVVIARSDVCRTDGLDEACARINLAADVGADVAMLFPANAEDTKRAPKLCKIPLIYVLSRGNREKRPLPSAKELEDMGYKICIDALTGLVVAFDAVRKAYKEIKETGDFTGLSHAECMEARETIERLIGLEDYYKIEAQTVEA